MIAANNKFTNLSDNGKENNNVLVPSHKATVGGSVNIVSTCHITVQPHPPSLGNGRFWV